MKRMTWVVLVPMLGFACAAQAQMGTDLFKRPSFTKVFHPVVGKGAEYETTSKSGSDAGPRTMDMGIVGKDSADGKDGYWLEFVVTDKGKTVVGKMLITPDDFQSHRMIFQMPGQGAMEMPVRPNAQNTKIADSMTDWHSVGNETITVPAGTFSCEHWRNDKNGSDVWASDKVSPFGMVKEAGKDSSTVLTKVLSDYPDRITGPVQKFDPQMMMQQMQRGQPPKP